MRVLIKDREPTGGMIGEICAELDDETIDAHGLRAPLEAFARAIAEQLDANGRYAGRVVGVELHTLDCALLLVKP